MRGRKIGACSQQRLQAGGCHCCYGACVYWLYCMSRFMRLECCVIVCLHVCVHICRHEEHRWSLNCLPNLLCAHVPARPAWRSRTSKSRCLYVQRKSSFSVLSHPDPRSRILMSSFCFADCPSPKAIFPCWQNVPTSLWECWLWLCAGEGFMVMQSCWRPWSLRVDGNVLIRLLVAVLVSLMADYPSCWN